MRLRSLLSAPAIQQFSSCPTKSVSPFIIIRIPTASRFAGSGRESLATRLQSAAVWVGRCDCVRGSGARSGSFLFTYITTYVYTLVNNIHCEQRAVPPPSGSSAKQRSESFFRFSRCVVMVYVKCIIGTLKCRSS